MTVSMDRVLSAAGQDGAHVRPPMKIELTLALLTAAYHERRYVCALDALNDHGDTCFHSSIADLREKGLEFIQRDHPHMHRHGGKALYQDYRLASGSIEKAESMLAIYRAGRRGISRADVEEACA